MATSVVKSMASSSDGPMTGNQMLSMWFGFRFGAYSPSDESVRPAATSNSRALILPRFSFFSSL